MKPPIPQNLNLKVGKQHNNGRCERGRSRKDFCLIVRPSNFHTPKVDADVRIGSSVFGTRTANDPT